jgi:hypothetical protein
MILQCRVCPHPQQLQRVETVRSEIDVLRSHLRPSDELLYFLIDHEYYQMKQKIGTQQRKEPHLPLLVMLHFTVFDKETSLAHTAEIWRFSLYRN